MFRYFIFQVLQMSCIKLIAGTAVHDVNKIAHNEKSSEQFRALTLSQRNKFWNYCRALPDVARQKECSPPQKTALASEVGAARFELTTLAPRAPRDTRAL